MAESTTKATPKKATTKPAAASAKPAAEKAASKAPVASAKPAAKKPAVKTAAPKPEAKAAATPAVKKIPAAEKKPVAKTRGKAMIVTDEQRYRMVAEAAYYRAESNQFKSDPLRDWIEAENDIASLLSGSK